MKLLSRFLWLIIGISAIVFAGISLVHFRADKEFKLIKESIGEEYNILIDKMISAEKSEILTTYNYGICNSSATATFLSFPNPIPEILMYDLDTMVMSHFKADAVWFYKYGGEPFYFFSHRKVVEEMLMLNNDEFKQIFEKKSNTDFYLNHDNILYRIFASKIGDTENPKGYLFTASIQDNRWIELYQKEINNSEISFIEKDALLPPIPKQLIRLERMLLSYDGSTAQKLIITLKLPFLKLWQSTSYTNNWLLSGAILLIFVVLITTLLIWVVGPLSNISKSLQKGNSDDIEPLIQNTTELGNVARMISDFHKKTEELESSEGIKRHIIEQAQVGILISEANSNLIITANPFACKLISAPEDAIVGNVTNSFLEVLPAKTKNEAGNAESFESKLFNSKNGEIPILRTTTQMFMDGRPVLMETFVDLSEIKGLQEKLEEEKKKISLAVRNSGLIFSEYDFSTDEVIIADEWKFLFSGNQASNSKNLLLNIDSSDIKKVTDQFDSLKNGNKDTLTTEFRVMHPGKGLTWLSVSILITKREDNKNPKQLIGLIEDITERISVQQELIKAKEKAEESDRMKSAYLGNMSHKIRTPLNAIVGFANLLTEEDIQPDDKTNFINIIRRDTEQVLHLIDDIINIAKIDANQMSVSEKPLSLNNLINELSDYYKVNDKTKTIKFEAKSMLPEGKDILKTDGDKLKQALSSLLDNAFKFTTKGSIELGYYINPVNNKVIIYVKDTGIGIPDESKDHIFNRFYQVDNQTEGTGLGLTICQGLVRILHGNLSFESKKDVGTSFFIELPFIEK
jgi:signal transduction histidine kinase